jgi:predicted RNase H-like nuclease (RuvC/YqgF family)
MHGNDRNQLGTLEGENRTLRARVEQQERELAEMQKRHNEVRQRLGIYNFEPWENVLAAIETLKKSATGGAP